MRKRVTPCGRHREQCLIKNRGVSAEHLLEAKDDLDLVTELSRVARARGRRLATRDSADDKSIISVILSK